MCGILMYFLNSIVLPQSTVAHPQKTEITIYPQNEVSTIIQLVNSPHSAGSMCSCELEPCKVQPRLLYPSPGKVSILSSYNVNRRVPQGSDQRSIHPSTLSLTVAISGSLRIERRKQGSYQEVS